jgi:hypothetical protein
LFKRSACRYGAGVDSVSKDDNISGLVQRTRQGTAIELLLYATNRGRATYLGMTILLRSGPVQKYPCCVTQLHRRQPSTAIGVAYVVTRHSPLFAIVCIPRRFVSPPLIIDESWFTDCFRHHCACPCREQFSVTLSETDLDTLDTTACIID